jgi:flagellar motor switch protein FliM
VAAQSQVTDKEVDALLERMRPAVEQLTQVSARDFKSPRRLSQPQVDALVRRVEKTLPDLTTHLSTWLRSPHKVQVASIVEAHETVLIDGLVEPMHTLTFECSGQLGLLAWDLGAMVAAIELALGAADIKESKARPLSVVEERIFTDAASRIVTLVGTALGVDAKSFRIVREKKSLSANEETGDPQRIGVHLALQGSAGESTLRLYYPAVKPPEIARRTNVAKDAKKNTLTAPLGEIDVPVRAELGTVELAVQDLLALELGDVIVLETLVGGPVTVAAEGQMRALADLGRREGKLAVRLRSIEKNTRPNGND